MRGVVIADPSPNAAMVLEDGQKLLNGTKVQ